MFLYDFGLNAYASLGKMASFFNSKIRKMVEGQRETADILRRGIAANDRVVWFHAASLGEFEQGRPIMERLRKQHPEYKILLSFFSPSGYEVRKNYEGADVICYLPFDTPRNAKKFIELAHPEIAIFIKYEFWGNYLTQLHERGVKTYSVSSIFRPGQRFFKKWNPYSKVVLQQFDHFFVQNETSKQLLAGIGIHSVTVSGDTRFDRVLDIRNASRDLPVVEAFTQGQKTFIAGSSWEPDEEIYIPYFSNHSDWKLIIAPHVISESHLAKIEKMLESNGISSVRYTSLEQDAEKAESTNGAEKTQCRCLIVDCFGKLSSIYRYGKIALVGGGFGAGIHNVPEAAVYGIPVLFGPNNQKFREAQILKKIGAGFEYSDADTFKTLMNRFLSDEKYMLESGEKSSKFIQENSGAADICYRGIFES